LSQWIPPSSAALGKRLRICVGWDFSKRVTA